jgi:hypothetical protein
MISDNYILRAVVAGGVLAASLAAASSARATDRRFTYTYESGTLGAGERELEPWTTLRLGRNEYYRAIDNRLELEFGITDRLMTAWYLNLSSATGDVPGSTPGSLNRETEIEHGGSWEWKYKLLDPVADPLGLALYLEGGFTTKEVELETKVIMDKRVGDFLFALNLVGEYEWDSSSGITKQEKLFELDAGAVYFFTPVFSAGLELRNQNEIAPEVGADGSEENEWGFSVLSAGPVVSYSAETWWATLTVLPQIANLKREGDAPVRELEEHEKIATRLIFGAHF